MSRALRLGPWGMGAARLLLLAPLLAGAPSYGQVSDMRCQTAPERVVLYDPAPARASFPMLVRNTFANDGTGPDRLDVDVLVPGALTPGCPSGSLEPLRGVRSLGDGLYEGFVVANSRSFHSHLFGETLTFTADQVWDWELSSDDTSGRLYGAYQLRWILAHRSVDGGAIMIRLMPDVIPETWQ